jgi:hypothetical protein
MTNGVSENNGIECYPQRRFQPFHDNKNGRSGAILARYYEVCLNAMTIDDAHAIWRLSHRADKVALPIADRHYNRQKPGTPQFVPPGRCLVLLANGPALWVTSWPYAQFTKHRWAGAWICTCFRREGGIYASDMIRQAVAVTRWFWPDIPELGMVTFIDRKKVKPTMVRGKNTWGYTYIKAGFEPDGETKSGLLAFRMKPERMPEPMVAAEVLF